MTANQSTQLAKSPNTKKAIAVLQKFAKKEAEFKALEKESKAAAELIKQAMIEQGITKIDVDLPNISGYITLAERVSFKAEDLSEVADDFLKQALDTDKVKAHATLTGSLPDGVAEARTQYITKKFKAKE
jgi:chemotaxis protein histidine kinase CheA